jgi:hypothetical protein
VRTSVYVTHDLSIDEESTAMVAKYTVTQSAVSQLLADVQGEKIAIPELQRPFVWDSVKVRDLMDSLYKGYPVGYLITWQSVGAALKGGQVAAHQQILIDGQQRVTALRAAVAGLPVVDKRYRKARITIAFNPVVEAFETTTPVLRKNPEWIADISEFFTAASSYTFMREYFDANPGAVDLDVQNPPLQALRLAAGLTLAEVAAATGMAYSTYCRLEGPIRSGARSSRRRGRRPRRARIDRDLAR